MMKGNFKNQNNYDFVIKYNFSNKEGVDFYISQKDGHFGLLNQNKSQVLPCDYDDIRHIYSDYLIAKTNNRFLIFDIDGKRSNIPVIDDYWINIFDGSALLTSENKVGVYSFTEKKIVIPIEFEDITYLSSMSFPKYFIVKRKEKYGVYFQEGSQKEAVSITDINYEDIIYVSQSLCAFKSNNKYQLGIIEHNRIEFEKERFDDLLLLTYKLFAIKQNKKWGLIQRDKKDLAWNLMNVDFQYEKVQIISKDEFAVRKNDVWGLVDLNGQSVIECLFDKVAGRIIVNKVNLIFGEINGVWFIVAPEEVSSIFIKDSSNVKLFETDFDDIEIINNDLFTFKKNGKWGLATCAFELITEKFSLDTIRVIRNNNYDKIIQLDDNQVLDYYYVLLEKDQNYEIIKIGRWSPKTRLTTLYYGAFNKLLLNKPFPSMNMIIYNCKESTDQEYELYDSNFNLMCPNRFDNFININSDNYLIFEKDKKYGVLARTGDIIVEGKYENLFVVGNTICCSEGSQIRKLESISDSFLLQRKCPNCHRAMVLKRRKKEPDS